AFYGSFAVGGVTYTAQGRSDLLLVHYKPDGTVGWARQIGSADQDELSDLVLNPAQSALYFSGTFQNTLNFYKPDGTPAVQATSAGYDDAFVAKYDLAGNVQWVRQVGGPLFDHGRGIDVDPQDRVYLTGNFEDKVAFPGAPAGTSFTSAGESDIFLARYKADGTFDLARQIGTAGNDRVNAASVNKQNGDVYLTGAYSTAANIFDSKVLVARYNAAGTLLSTKTYGAAGGYNEGTDIVATSEGLYLTGDFRKSLSFPPFTLTSGGWGDDMYLVYLPYALNGNALWANKFGGPESDVACDLAYRPWDNGLGGGDVYVTGTFEGTATFGNKSLTSAVGGLSDLFLAHLTGNGTFDWVYKLSSTGYDWGRSVSLSSSNTLFVTALHGQTVTVGNTTLSQPGGMLMRIDLPTVSDFRLIKAATDTEAGTLSSPAEINYYTLGTNQINLKVNSVTGTTKSVKLVLDGVSKIDNGPVFSWAGDGLTLNGTDFFPFTPTLGPHTLEVTPYSGANATGIAGQKRILKFTVVSKPVLAGVDLINAQFDVTVKSLLKSPTIDYAQLGTKQINLRANTNPAKAGSVVFVLDGVPRCDNVTPYSWMTEQIKPNGAIDYLAFTPTLGVHTLKVTAYTGANGTGTASNTIQFTFTVTNGGAGARLASGSDGPEGEFAQLTAAPNPFAGRTTLSFTATEDGPATLEVYNSQGQPVARLFEGNLQKGQAYEWHFDGTTQPAGLYVARLKLGNQVRHQRLVLSK
ncbi:MAG: T9SS type A sorting domain-containing protein, partial [Cytophagales bacterium]|nr:T9SS type A sorting domain-containing protein [Cytophagales bacterium]